MRIALRLSLLLFLQGPVLLLFSMLAGFGAPAELTPTLILLSFLSFLCMLLLCAAAAENYPNLVRQTLLASAAGFTLVFLALFLH